MQARYEVAHVLRAYWERIDHLGLNSWQVRTLRAIRDCRTAALGGHIDSCDDCGMLSISYNSCRNRHCPLPRWIFQIVIKPIFEVNFPASRFQVLLPCCGLKIFYLHLGCILYKKGHLFG